MRFPRLFLIVRDAPALRALVDTEGMSANDIALLDPSLASLIHETGRATVTHDRLPDSVDLALARIQRGVRIKITRPPARFHLCGPNPPGGEYRISIRYNTSCVDLADSFNRHSGVLLGQQNRRVHHYRPPRRLQRPPRPPRGRHINLPLRTPHLPRHPHLPPTRPVMLQRLILLLALAALTAAATLVAASRPLVALHVETPEAAADWQASLTAALITLSPGTEIVDRADLSRLWTKREQAALSAFVAPSPAPLNIDRYLHARRLNSSRWLVELIDAPTGRALGSLAINAPGLADAPQLATAAARLPADTASAAHHPDAPALLQFLVLRLSLILRAETMPASSGEGAAWPARRDFAPPAQNLRLCPNLPPPSCPARSSPLTFLRSATCRTISPPRARSAPQRPTIRHALSRTSSVSESARAPAASMAQRDSLTSTVSSSPPCPTPAAKSPASPPKKAARPSTPTGPTNTSC